MRSGLYTAEAVGGGHPDKLCDRVSDAILDAYLVGDPWARVAVETLATRHGLVLAGEVASNAYVDRVRIAKDVVNGIYPGYGEKGVVDTVVAQSPEIGLAVMDGGAGDQGIVVGYATNETEEMLPLPVVLAQGLRDRVSHIGWGPDLKTQVTVRYKDGVPVRVVGIVVSVCHPAEVPLLEVRGTLRRVVDQYMLEEGLPVEDGALVLQPSGVWTVGGPQADTGLTGRKIVADSYGTWAPHGGGAYSGKDPSKVDRSGAYGARWVARSVVSGGWASRCTVEVAYAIGREEPVAVRIDTHGTGTVPEVVLEKVVLEKFELTPLALREALGLEAPLYEGTVTRGHFHESMPWEKDLGGVALLARGLEEQG